MDPKLREMTGIKDENYSINKNKSLMDIFLENPLVPTGLLATGYILVKGMKTLKGNDSKASNMAMRMRVTAQAVTVACIMGSVLYKPAREKVMNLFNIKEEK
eukprot:TRINITY_DN2614_c0_g1_i1.p1 TRINITY_DN2614_c0_g1~~TRINITY_DN2614_c0_g1_i1.p1  ORF type:complete len:102 (-),score=24.00 TRINITY_DN2614_c0_g1_i1:32-337(-)